MDIKTAESPWAAGDSATGGKERVADNTRSAAADTVRRNLSGDPEAFLDGVRVEHDGE